MKYYNLPLKLVVYDKENNVIHMQGLNLYNNGYSTEDIKYFTKFLKNHAHLLYEFAKMGGFENA